VRPRLTWQGPFINPMKGSRNEMVTRLTAKRVLLSLFALFVVATIVDETIREPSSHCRFVLNSVFPLDLTLAQDGASVSGTTRFYSNGGRLVLAGAFAGTSDTAGNLSLTGTITSVDGSEQPETTTIHEWRSSLSSNADMTGAFVQHKQFTNAFGPQVSVEGCARLKTQRHAPPVQ
jgi:hypothetical protein